MAGDWIKVRTLLPTDGRLKVVSRLCHVSTVTVFGALVTLWCLADSHANETGELVGYTMGDIDALVGIPGFCDTLPAEWLDTRDEFVKLPEYQEHNGSTAKTRAQDGKRQQRHRQAVNVSRTDRDTSVTREEKRREEKKEDLAPEVLIPLKDGTDYPVTLVELTEWKSAYARIDPLAETRKARAWCLSNPERLKTARGAPKFLNGWMARAQKDAESKPVSTASVAGGGRKAL